MGTFSLRLLPIVGVSLFACAMGAFFAESASAFPQASGVIPASLAFVAVGLLGSVVVGAMRHHERRFREFEQRLREMEMQMGDSCEEK
jgi:hypothetical protein